LEPVHFGFSKLQSSPLKPGLHTQFGGVPILGGAHFGDGPTGSGGGGGGGDGGGAGGWQAGGVPVQPAGHLAGAISSQ
jgi:hypothetical protein